MKKKIGFSAAFALLLCLIGGCGHNNESISDRMSALPEQKVAEEPATPQVSYQMLESLLKKTAVTLQMPTDIYETNLWDLGMRIDPNGNRYYDPILLSAFCTSLCNATLKKPINASVSMTEDLSEPFAYVPDTSGVTVDPNRMASLLTAMDYNADAYSIVLPTVEIPAGVTVQSLTEQHALLATYSTSFKKSPLCNSNRVFNIKKAAAMINGSIVMPGETFSMNRTIGDRNRKNGWKTAAAITGGTYAKEYGGGVCQVSSTLFNTVLMADLAIVERYHHSWPMTYVPIGRDATISTGSKDFIFQNNTDAPITIIASVNEKAKTVTVSLYGEQPDGYAYIELESVRTGTLATKGEKRILDESLPSGTKHVERKARTGKTSVTYQCFYNADGLLIERREAFRDSYPSIQGIVYLSSDLYY